MQVFQWAAVAMKFADEMRDRGQAFAKPDLDLRAAREGRRGGAAARAWAEEGVHPNLLPKCLLVSSSYHQHLQHIHAAQPGTTGDSLFCRNIRRALRVQSPYAGGGKRVSSAFLSFRRGRSKQSSSKHTSEGGALSVAWVDTDIPRIEDYVRSARPQNYSMLLTRSQNFAPRIFGQKGAFILDGCQSCSHAAMINNGDCCYLNEARVSTIFYPASETICDKRLPA